LFGNNALKPMLDTGLKEDGTVTDELLAKLNAAFIIASEQSPQDCTAIR
jgi:hypothetical protein